MRETTVVSGSDRISFELIQKKLIQESVAEEQSQPAAAESQNDQPIKEPTNTASETANETLKEPTQTIEQTSPQVLDEFLPVEPLIESVETVAEDVTGVIEPIPSLEQVFEEPLGDETQNQSDEELPAEDSPELKSVEASKTPVAEENSVAIEEELSEPSPAAEPFDDSITESTLESDSAPVPQNSSQQIEPVRFFAAQFQGRAPTVVKPAAAKRQRLSGLVILRGFVNENGEIESLSVYQSSNHLVLDEAAIAQASKWQFKPANANGVSTGQWVEIPVQFR